MVTCHTAHLCDIQGYSMNRALRLTLLSLAAFRLTRLTTRDDFPPVLRARNWVIDRRPDVSRWHSHLRTNLEDHWWGGSLVTCPWCASGWISLALVGYDWARHRDGSIVDWPAVWGAAALLHKWSEN